MSEIDCIDNLIIVRAMDCACYTIISTQRLSLRTLIAKLLEFNRDHPAVGPRRCLAQHSLPPVPSDS